MARPQPQTQQGGLAAKPQPGKDSPATSPSADSQPVFRDWAAI